MYIDYRIMIYGCIAYIHYVYICTIYTYAYIEQKIWGCRLVKSQFSQLVSAYGRFQGNLFIIRVYRFLKSYMTSDLCCA